MSRRQWYKGNLHTHTTRSDGDSEPQVVARWYARHKYHFLVLTDHNHLTLLDTLTSRRVHWPLLIPGEEVTVVLQQGGNQVHLNGIGITRLVKPVDAGEVAPTLRANVDAIHLAGGLALINHPNFVWAFDHQAVSQVKRADLLEIYSGHPWVNTHGGGGNPGHEEIWDRVLSAGTRVYGVAVDDTHHLKGEFGAARSNPGRGWVMVRATECSQEALLDSMRRGDFYSSSGVLLKELEASSTGLSLEVMDYVHEYDVPRYTTSFIGLNGRLLARRFGPRAMYEADASEGYVRAVVQASNGTKAWTQPVFLSPA